MSAFSRYLEDKILNHVLGHEEYTAPETLYIALFTSDPTDHNTGTEVSGNGYARQSVSFDTSEEGSSSNSTEVAFPIATGSWGTITHSAIYDSETEGNLLWYGELTKTKTIDVDDQIRLPIGNLSITID